MLSNHLIFCCPFPSIRIFSNESALWIRWSKYWSFSISPFKEYSGWFPLGLTGLISLQSKGLSESSLAPHFESISSLVLGLLYGPTLISTHVQFSSVAQSCPTLCDTMNHSTPGPPVHHQLPESTQTHVQPSHLLSIHDYWKKHSFDYRDLFQQSDVSAFEYAVWVCHSFSSKEQGSVNFMAAVTICSEFAYILDMIL